MSRENPQLAALTMQLAQCAAILTVPYTLERDSTGQETYVETKAPEVDTIRQIIDAAAEDGASDDGSYEQIVDIIECSSTIAKLDILNFWEQVAFCWVAGCSQMGVENFALHAPHKGLYALSPAYGLIATAIIIPNDKELKLSVNRKRKGITPLDFEVAMKRCGLKQKIIKGVFTRFVKSLDKWCEIIDSSEISNELKINYKKYLSTQIEKIHFVD